MKRTLLLVATFVLVALAVVDVYFWFGPSKTGTRVTRAPTASSSPRLDPGTPVSTPTIVAATETAAPSPVVAEAKPPAKPAVPKRRKPAKGTPPPPVASAPPVPAEGKRRAFVPSVTAIEGASGRRPSVPAGFDEGGVRAKPVPKIAAQIEFEIQPKPARAGDAYAVKIYLRNDGMKALKIKELRVGSSLNGARSEGALTPRLKEIPPAQVALLAEIPSVWKANVNAWGLDVTVRAAHGEVYRNSVAWR